MRKNVKQIVLTNDVSWTISFFTFFFLSRAENCKKKNGTDRKIKRMLFSRYYYDTSSYMEQMFTFIIFIREKYVSINVCYSFSFHGTRVLYFSFLHNSPLCTIFLFVQFSFFYNFLFCTIFIFVQFSFLYNFPFYAIFL